MTDYAPGNSAYLLALPDSNLPNSYHLITSDGLGTFVAGGGQLEIYLSGALSLMPVLCDQESGLGFLSTNGNGGLFKTQFLSDGTISISNASGGSNTGFSVVQGSSIQKVICKLSGQNVSTRTTLNFIPSTGIDISVTDNAGTNSADIFISANAAMSAPFLLTNQNSNFPNAQNLGGLGSGILLSSVDDSGQATVAIATPGYDYMPVSSNLIYFSGLQASAGCLIQGLAQQGNVPGGWKVTFRGNPGQVLTMGNDLNFHWYDPSWQPSTPVLTAIANLVSAGYISIDGAGNAYSRTFSDSATTSVTNGTGVAGNTSINVTPDTTVQQINVQNAGTTTSTRSNLNLIAGQGAVITVVDNPGNNRADVTISGVGGSDPNATYVTLTDETTNEPNSFSLGTLTTGLVKNTVSSGTAALTCAVPGTDYVAPNTILTNLSAVASNGYISMDSSGAVYSRTVTGDASINVTNGTGVSGNTSLSVNPGTTVQKINVKNSGTLVGTRTGINFIAGSNVSLTVTDDPSNNVVGVTIANTSVPYNTGTYVTLTNETSSLANSFSLGSLAGGILKTTVTTGTATIAQAIAGTDYVAPSANLTALSGMTVSKGLLITSTDGTNLVAQTAGTTGQFYVMSASGYGTWQTINYQAESTNLTSLAALEGDGYLSLDSSGNAYSRTFSDSATTSITNGTGVAGNTSVNVTPDTSVQRINISGNGTLVGTRPSVNFGGGTGIDVTVTEDAPHNIINVGIASTSIAATYSGTVSSASSLSLATTTEGYLAITPLPD